MALALQSDIILTMLYVYVASIYARILELPRHSSHRVCHRQEPSCGDLACWQYNNWVANLSLQATAHSLAPIPRSHAVNGPGRMVVLNLPVPV